MTFNKIVIGPDNVASTAPASFGDLISPTTLLTNEASLARVGIYVAIFLLIK